MVQRLLLGFAATACSVVALAQSHPMDALTPDEITGAVRLVKTAAKAGPDARFPAVTLLEEPKSEILKWQPGQPFRRHAFVNYFEHGRLFEAIVDLTRRHVDSLAEVKGRQPAILVEEFLGAGELVKKDARWQAAMRKRGYTKYDNLLCLPLTVGPAYDPRFAGKRLLNVPCYDRAGAVNNVYGRPIEGLYAVVDLVAKRVLDVVDLGVVPVPSDIPSHQYDPATSTRAQIKPVRIVSPEGSNFTISGSTVTWDKWRFHVRVDKRFGPVISLVRYDDGGTERSIIYQMNVSDMFVPYMDPAPSWSFKAYMDVSEYGFGMLASALQLGSDCPVNAKMLDAVISDDKGDPLTLKNVVCIFERDTGDPLWRHYEVFTDTLETRPNVELVVRMAPSVGNYDYLVDFVFNRRGEIDVRAGAYGIDAVKAVAAQKMSDATAKADTEYGTLLAPGLVGDNHDHYLSFRLDFDVDGTANRFVRDAFVKHVLPPSSRRRTLWKVETSPVTNEQAIDLGHRSEWLRIESVGRRNALGNTTSYQLMPGHTDTSILGDEEPMQRRAGFSSAPIWVSRFKADELFAAGRYPNQNQEVEGLPKYIADHEGIDGQDLVVWYTIGFRHQTRAEDWPAMPGLWHGFKLRPFNFFNKNPGLDVPPAAKQ